MDDQKLLELAAKAAGIEIEPCTCSDERFPFRLKNGHGHWNPLYRDGDALRLAVACDMDIELEKHGVSACGFDSANHQLFEWHRDDKMAATRRAIVRAAADAGMQIQPAKGHES